MHGVKRVRPGQKDPEHVAQAKAAKEKARIDDYLALRGQLDVHRENGDFDERVLDLTSRILAINPEYPTGWAYRRRILQKTVLKTSDSKLVQKTLEADLYLTSKCLMRNPKEYAVWNHRKWLLRTMPDPDWQFELATVEGLLERDARNYHGWDYRRYIIASLQTAPPAPESSTRQRPKPTIQSELAYTTQKISASFSNYSAWHYRSKLLARQWDQEGWGPEHPERRKRIEQEYDLIQQALYTDPDDQSAWIYHRWLTRDADQDTLQRQIQLIAELLEVEPDSKWCLESLVYYKNRAMLLQGDKGSQENLRSDCLTYLEKLKEVDKLRLHRYEDLAQELL